MSTIIEDTAYLEKLLETVKNKFSLTDYETEFLKEINIELRRPTPSTKLGLEERVTLLDNYKVRLHNMLFMLENKFNEIEYQYKSRYNPEYSRLVKAGRPSGQAIEAEIFANKLDLKEKHDLLQDWESFKALLTSYIKTLRDCKETCFNKVV